MIEELLFLVRSVKRNFTVSGASGNGKPLMHISCLAVQMLRDSLLASNGVLMSFKLPAIYFC